MDECDVFGQGVIVVDDVPEVRRRLASPVWYHGRRADRRWFGTHVIDKHHLESVLPFEPCQVLLPVTCDDDDIALSEQEPPCDEENGDDHDEPSHL